MPPRELTTTITEWDIVERQLHTRQVRVFPREAEGRLNEETIRQARQQLDTLTVPINAREETRGMEVRDSSAVWKVIYILSKIIRDNPDQADEDIRNVINYLTGEMVRLRRAPHAEDEGVTRDPEWKSILNSGLTTGFLWRTTPQGSAFWASFQDKFYTYNPLYIIEYKPEEDEENWQRKR
jgi:hypothetical protein